MKHRLITIFTSILLMFALIDSMVEYTYDDAGNRVEKTNG